MQPNLLVVFTRRSVDTTFLSAFEVSGIDVIDISRKVDGFKNLAVNVLYRGKIAQQLSQQRRCKWVFNGQCNFAYKLSIWLPKRIKQYELIHSFNSFSWIRIPYIECYEVSVTVNQDIVDKHSAQLNARKAPYQVVNRLTFKHTGIEVQAVSVNSNKYVATPLRVLYVGRGTEEKRVHLNAKLAAKLAAIAPNTFEFHFAGDVAHAIPISLQKYCVLHGDIKEKQQLNSLYSDCHVLLMLSSTESGPLVTMEAMLSGLVVISTNVGFAYKSLDADQVVDVSTNDDALIESVTSKLLVLNNDRMRLKTIGLKNHEVAKTTFDENGFKNFIVGLLNI
ncbi:MAG TPA: hypothetical protein DCQ29_13810 [Chitinophagaceae bacterium]|nr:hypothetical protein [Chitinophagaceae bacterium]